MIAPLGYMEGLTIGEHWDISSRSFHLVLVGSERDSQVADYESPQQKLLSIIPDTYHQPTIIYKFYPHRVPISLLVKPPMITLELLMVTLPINCLT